MKREKTMFAKQMQRVEAFLRGREEVPPWVLEGEARKGLQEAMKRHPSAGFVTLEGEGLKLIIWWFGARVGIHPIPIARRPKDGRPPLRIEIPQDSRRARVRALGFSMAGKKREWGRRQAERLGRLLPLALGMEEPPISLSLEAQEKLSDIAWNELLSGRPHLPVWVWQDGKWEQVLPWRLTEELRVPVVGIACNLLEEGVAFTPLGPAEWWSGEEPGSVLRELGLSPGLAQRVEGGEPEAVEEIRQLARRKAAREIPGE